MEGRGGFSSVFVIRYSPFCHHGIPLVDFRSSLSLFVAGGHSRGGLFLVRGGVVAMSWFGGKDWNIVAVIFEKPDMYRVNGNRAKGSDSTKMRDGAKIHPRTICWAVFDQKRAFVEGGTGKGLVSVAPTIGARLVRDLPKLKTVQEILSFLEKGTGDKAAKALEWDGYPPAEKFPE
jgi:hypothetical protein